MDLSIRVHALLQLAKDAPEEVWYEELVQLLEKLKYQPVVIKLPENFSFTREELEYFGKDLGIAWQ